VIPEAVTVVSQTWLEPDIAVIGMADHANKNGLSRALLEGLREIFEAIARERRARVVVLHGYGNYFCTGGTQELLLELAEGQKTFVERGYFRLLLDCEVPVIAAVQGHAIGGGLTFACSADLTVFAREAVLSANYMQYGLTPGAGATLFIPHRFGPLLGHEMLLRANRWRGRDLEQRGVGAHVVPATEVIDTALSIARELAASRREALCLLKNHLAAPLRRAIEETTRQELAMHQQLMASAEVADLIRDRFHT
jgi:polyketide biosynthesis enoyl-CoA hydratase PksI